MQYLPSQLIVGFGELIPMSTMYAAPGASRFLQNDFVRTGFVSEAVRVRFPAGRISQFQVAAIMHPKALSGSVSVRIHKTAKPLGKDGSESSDTPLFVQLKETGEGVFNDPLIVQRDDRISLKAQNDLVGPYRIAINYSFVFEAMTPAP